MESENRKTILFALAANLFIAVAKLAGGVLTGSSALLAEAAGGERDGRAAAGRAARRPGRAAGRHRPDATRDSRATAVAVSAT